MAKLKKVYAVYVITFLILGFSLYEIAEVLAQGGPPPSSGPPKVDIFAREVTNNAILVTWENPDDVADDIVYRYSVSRDVNSTENFVEVFSSLRDIEEKIIDESNGQEMFFFLDSDIKPSHTYEYRISASAIQGNPNPVLSDDTRPIFIDDFVEFTKVESNGHLIVGRTLTPIQPILWWNDWFSPQLVSAEQLTNPIFTTSLNPKTESYRLALEPVPQPEGSTDCNETLEFEYTKNDVKGQDFDMVVSLFETEIQTDDDTGVEVAQEVKLLRHQKTFQNFTDSEKLRQKWHVVHPEDQKIYNYSQLEIQFDITGKNGDPRQISMWQVLFTVPVGNKAC